MRTCIWADFRVCWMIFSLTMFNIFCIAFHAFLLAFRNFEAFERLSECFNISTWLLSRAKCGGRSSASGACAERLLAIRAEEVRDGVLRDSECVWQLIPCDLEPKSMKNEENPSKSHAFGCVSSEAKLKCVLVGPESVGKTALVSRLCDQTFLPGYLLLGIFYVQT